MPTGNIGVRSRSRAACLSLIGEAGEAEGPYAAGRNGATAANEPRSIQITLEHSHETPSE